MLKIVIYMIYSDQYVTISIDIIANVPIILVEM